MSDTYKVNKREFVRHFSKYLETAWNYELEAWGKVTQVVKIEFLSVPKKVIKTKEDAEEIIKKFKSPRYSCGCLKYGAFPICGAHGKS